MTPPRGPDRSEGGAVLVLTSLLLVVLMGMAALAIDAANAWSTKRLAQNNADMAALSAVVKIPRSYLPGGPSPQIQMGTQTASSAIQIEVNRITQANGCDPGCATSVLDTAGAPAGYFGELTVRAEIVSGNAFAPAIGAPDSFSTEGSATASIKYNVPLLDVMPIGISGGGRYRCLTSGALAGCTNTIALGIGNRNTLPDQCVDKEESFIYHVINGLGFLIDTDYLTDPRPDSLSGCLFGHEVTLPNAPRRLIAITPTMVTGGLVNGRLAGDTTVLWDLLPDNGHADCDAQAMRDMAVTDVDMASDMMTICMGRSPVFDLNKAPWENRLVWGLEIGSTGSGRYTGWTPIWLHTYLDAAGKEHLVAPPNVAGFTFFVLRPQMLGSFIGLLDPDPGGLDNLDFELTD